MSTFIIDVPMPAMGATVSELTIINLVVTPGTKVTKGQKLADLESDKSAFEFEAPIAGMGTSIMKVDMEEFGWELGWARGQPGQFGTL